MFFSRLCFCVQFFFARYRIVLQQVCILQTSKDIFKTLFITDSKLPKLPCSAVGRAAEFLLMFSRSWVQVPSHIFFLISIFLKILQIRPKRIFREILYLHIRLF